MTSAHRMRTHRAVAGILLGALAASACGERAKQHATDGDTGAAAPATVRDMSATPRAPDSTPGVSAPTGQPAAAGDTLGARAKATTKKP
jgi:hypothetical protein